ncbi:uncharacterized protein JCM15063_005011 [Sporobolomyces koalae]|uniref:uncharacterized protein n=1 Tax=Sporobolomyces koalae TaxID=500713 RepID=UPI0031797E35
MTAQPDSQRRMASLGGLPPELKAQIVAELYQDLLLESYSYDALTTPPSRNWPTSVGPAPLLTDESPRNEPPIRASPDDSAWVDEDDDDNDDDDDDGQDDNDDHLAFDHDLAAGGFSPARGSSPDPELDEGLFALTLVNHEFAELAYVWLYKQLDLENRSTESLLFLINEILPRHAQHVRALAFGYDGDMYVGAQPATVAYAGQDLAEKAEQLTGIIDSDPPTDRARVRRARSLLIAKIIELCPHLELIDCEAFQKHPIDEDAYEDDPVVINQDDVYEVDHAIQAIRNRAPNLIDLTLLVNDDEFTNEGDVAYLLEGCRNLKRLGLESYVVAKIPEQRAALHQAVLNLDKLEILSVNAGFFVDDRFVELVKNHPSTPPFPLQTLALTECPDLSFASFVDLIHAFSDTLLALDIDSTPSTNHPGQTEKFLGKPFNLPKLEALALTTTHEAKFLQSFVDCKLVELSFGFCPAIAYKDLEAFITQHQETLRRVEISDDVALSDAQLESLEVFCHAKGIRLEMLPPDSSSEGSDVDPSDLDDDGWYDGDSDLIQEYPDFDDSGPDNDSLDGQDDDFD